MVRLARLLRVALCFVAASLFSVACGDETPRMRVLTTQPHSGDRVVVRFDVSPVTRWERGERWLTLVPLGAAEHFIGERVMIDEGAMEGSVATGDAGPCEIRLVDVAPLRGPRVLARARLDIAAAASAAAEAPAWYW